MNQIAKNIGIDFIPPICVLALAIFLLQYVPAGDITESSMLIYLPFFFIGTAILLSWKFNQLDNLFVNILICVAYAGIIAVHNSDQTTMAHYFLSISVLVPANILLFRLWQITSLFSLAGLARTVIIAGESYLVFWASKSAYLPLFDVFSFSPVSNFTLLPDSISQLSALLFALCSLVYVGFIAFLQKPSDSTMLVAVITVFISCANNQLPFVFLAGFSAIAIMLAISTIQTSYNMAFVDTLTGLPSRRAMELELKKLGRRFTIAMLDIDHFKKLNDTYGHDVGDQVLRMVAKHIRRVGGGGRPARYGGEEFAIIFPNRTINDATPFLEVVRRNIADASFALRDKDRPKKIPKTRAKRKKPSDEISVTISIGVAERDRQNKLPSSVLKLADDALYKAKKQGRNRVC